MRYPGKSEFEEVMSDIGTCEMCSSPAHADDLRQCDSCERYYHTECIDWTEHHGGWYCEDCAEDEKLHISILLHITGVEENKIVSECFTTQINALKVVLSRLQLIPKHKADLIAETKNKLFVLRKIRKQHNETMKLRLDVTNEKPDT